MTETDLQRQIQVDLSDENTRLLRNTVGFGWQGDNFTIRKGKLVAGVARPVTFGLGPGTSDLIGPHSVIVTPAMIGTRIAVFSAIETKLRGRRATNEQARYLASINELGGLAGIAYAIDDARDIISRRTFPIVTRF